MPRAILLLSVFFLALCAPLHSQRNTPIEIEVQDMEATPLGVNITLRTVGTQRQIRMAIGFTEAQAISQALRHRDAPRPMTHDLLKMVLERNGWRVQKVLIREYSMGTFLADLTLEKNGETQVYDVRPSDAMAIGLRFDAKIYVNPEVLRQQEEQEQEEREINPTEPKTRTL